jgi:transcriptional repressor NrdR
VVLERLRHLSEVAYLRFASVYRRFRDIKDFAHELEQLEQLERPSRQDLERLLQDSLASEGSTK